MKFKSLLRKIAGKEPGMILPLALILLMAATFIVMPGLTFMSSLLTISSGTLQDTEAYYAADAGITAVWWYFNKNPAAPSWPYTLTVNGLPVQVTLLSDTKPSDSSYDNYTIQSSVSISGGTKPHANVVALIQVPQPGNNIFNQAVASLNGNVTVQSSGHIISDGRQAGNYGNIYANGSISVTPSSAVGGTCCSACNTCGSGTAALGVASATGSVTVSNCDTGTCVGSSVSGASPVSYTVNVTPFINQASAGTHYSSNPVLSHGPMNLGPAYITGDVTIGGSVTVTLTGTVYCTGNLTITGSALVKGAYTMVCGGNLTVSGGSTASLVAGTIPFLICQGTTVTVSGSASIAAVIYAPNAAATLSGGVPTPPGYNVYGAVIAKSVTVSSMTIEYLSGIHSETQIPGAGLGGSPVFINYSYQ
jgi:hypothetical protein